jgi:D-3-phosphoglycerate dehydrogenase
MERPDVLIIGPYPQWDMDDLESTYTLHKLYLAPDADGLLTRIGASVRGIATRGELGASAKLMERLPKLEIVACYGVGTDAIDLGHARSRGIVVTNTPDVLTEDVADLGVGLLLAVCRNMVAADAHVRAGHWASSNLALSTRLHGKRVGIVGMGAIGSAVARRLAAFGCTIAYSARQSRAGSPYEFIGDVTALARWSQMLVVTVAGGTATRGLITAEVFDALGPDGIFVNISRGTTVDETALLDALEHGRIKAAGLDVFLNEPRIDPRFLALDNVVLQPHHASGTIETRKAMGQLVRDNLAAHFAGRPVLTPVP